MRVRYPDYSESFQVPTPVDESALKSQLAAWGSKFGRLCPSHGEPTDVCISHSPDYGGERIPDHLNFVFTFDLLPCPSCKVRDVGVPPILEQCSFANFIARTDEDRSNLCKSREFAAAPHGFLLLLGRPGTGKSHLAVSILREHPCRGRYTRHLDLVGLLRDTYRRPSAPRDEDAGLSAKEELDRIFKTRLLILDEAGVAPGGNDAETMLYDLIDYRVSNRLPTVITANVPAEKLQEVFGERAADRLRLAKFAVLNFTGPSHRPGLNEEYLNASRPRGRATK